MLRASFAAVAFFTLTLAGLGCENTVLVTRCSDGECGGDGEGAAGAGPTTTSTTKTTTTGNPCTGGEAYCNGTCVDTTSDPFNCGACGNPCGPGVQCIDSQCVGACGDSLLLCNGQCIDPMFDQQHCGGCFQPCNFDEFCNFGFCEGGGCEDGGICGICDTAFLSSNVPQSVTGTNANAENNFFPSCTGTSIPEVQHVFTAPTAGTYQFDTIGSTFDTSLSLLDPFGCFEMQCNDDTFGVDAMVQSFLQAGQTVHIVVDGFSTGTYQLNISQVDQCMGGLTNCNGDCVDTLTDTDNCGFCNNPCGFNESCQMGFCQTNCVGPCGACNTPIVIGSMVPQTVSGNTTGAPDHLVPSCTGQLGPEHYYSFTAPTAGSYIFSTANSAYDTVLTVLSGSSCAELGCNDDFGGPTSRVTATLAQGQLVYVIVDGKNTSGQYNLLVNATPTPTCPTSNLGNVVPVTVSGSTIGATNTFVPSCVPGSTAGENTYTFTAPVTATYEMNTFGSGYDTVLSVLGATCTGASLACDDDTPGMGTVSQIFVNLTAGQTVTVVVDGWAQSSGSYVLNILQQ
ncbi:MAG: hypothetical protein HOV80_25815 [Polyangiaceae bacterium]|nr:hypothetical protein [Polyangiaceae bacterium]